MSGADELDEAIALANSGRTRPTPPPAPRLKRIRRIEWNDDPRRSSEDDAGEGVYASDGAPYDPDAEEAEETGEDAQEAAESPAARRPRATALPTWEEAREQAARSASALPATTLPLDHTLGHTLAAPVCALTDLPSFDTSAMDGWAVAGPGPWAVAGADGGDDAVGILAGDTAEPPQLADGEAVRIATGARIPPGTSAVLRAENADVTGKGRRLRTPEAPQPGADIRSRGQECRTGDELLPEGLHITPAVLGLCAAAGYDELRVVRRPRAEVLVLGDELLHRGLPRDGRIRDALGPMVGPWLNALGADVIATRRLGDDAEALYEVLSATTADMVVTTGSTASGPVDHLQPTLRRLGAELLVHGVRVRPGHPMLLAALPAQAHAGSAPPSASDAPRRAHLVGLPGNPLAALSGLVTLAAPLLYALAGRVERPLAEATLGAEVSGHPSDTRLVPVVREGSGLRARVQPLRYAGPAMLRGVAAADALAVVPPGGAAPGTDVTVVDLPW
ncbi:molybdopterin molybdenumtransferase MoeA [Streptomyces sp. NHF165]|uniref:molybdopterin molybdotransferase MoeA n=1 Tax=Streptomyces sp. NHF165 TaxID=2175864 RepID=UPI00132EFB3B|nr:molybdopterin molybdotransferase MoeA [Streptomyces sp. NHF165]QHF92606.1 molybdopterin molybdenumtransferase MoeA [Streptomyces sp. NHF165]